LLGNAMVSNGSDARENGGELKKVEPTNTDSQAAVGKTQYISILRNEFSRFQLRKHGESTLWKFNTTMGNHLFNR